MDISQWDILIVDDTEDNADLIAQLLEHYGARVKSAPDVDGGMQLALAQRPMLVLADLAMPGKDGWQLLQAIRSEASLSGVPVIAMTSYHSPSVERDALRAGFDAYLPKPININRLLETLSTMLNK